MENKLNPLAKMHCTNK